MDNTIQIAHFFILIKLKHFKNNSKTSCIYNLLANLKGVFKNEQK